MQPGADLGAIVHLIRAILRKFNDCVEITLDVCGLAAKRLGQCVRLMLAKHNGRDGQRYVLSYTTDYFSQIQINSDEFR